ncbi:hypothetical protein JYB54_004550 [Salmonella enterica]|nr:hypothetical protein [Salmonella enterica]EDP9449839.1 hypothetical protein [Salmonella enterica subsp. enterica]EHP7187552.1 hypothetical protein [Salmonella enterica subsp. enterica serovar Thompson]EAS9367101.1 hypothetical protein [Salmonella enterica]EBO9513477.1 hypothetical protein [Salmonella enterica]
MTLDATGRTTSVQQTAPRPYSQKETLQVAVAKANNREPAEMFPNLDFSKGEPERQTIARQQAEQAWTGKPENIRSFDEDVDGFKYQVRLNDLGEVQSVTKTADRPYTKKENLKVAVAKANHKAPTKCSRSWILTGESRNVSSRQSAGLWLYPVQRPGFSS